MTCSTFTDVLVWSSWPSSNFFLMILMAGSMGTDVNSAETSYEAYTFIGLQSDPFQLLDKITSVLNVVGGIAN